MLATQIEGITCIVVRDVAESDGARVEDTFNWYATATNSELWYFGEIAQNLRAFEGDDPEALADRMCNDDCVVARDFSPLEPGVEERKCYAKGIGSSSR